MLLPSLLSFIWRSVLLLFTVFLPVRFILRCHDMNIAESYQSQSVLFESDVHGRRLKAGRVYEVAIGNWRSPKEFHVVFRRFEEALQELQQKLNEFYADSVAPADLSNVGVGAPCCVRAYKNWHRAEVLWPCETDGGDFHVRFVDSGEMKYVPKEDVRLLATDFASLPPLAVECEMLGINRHCLTCSILNNFTRRCRRRSTFKLSFVAEFENKLFVRLFDRDMNDLFFVYFGEVIKRAEQAERQRERLNKLKMKGTKVKMEQTNKVPARDR
ncbi:hypothetical protein M514_03172 [Trichuris suis]|uniref:Tudor domain-containing protein n=1 Tax=Trichuris suis TaxID=68888 RepID=A0A085N948_9BILA|nr:hypothetical protein M514_03172 [Trichuris suis]